MQIKQEKGHYTLYKESEAIGTAVVDGCVWRSCPRGAGAATAAIW